MSVMNSCPCGSALPYRDCCEPLHRGEREATIAEALMRSRYSAFVLKRSDYLIVTWHPSTRPSSLDISDDDTPWQRLAILVTERGTASDSEGVVEFAAYYRGGQLHERSRFVKEDGRWFYVDGDILPSLAATKVGRNDPCSCGSGRKFKRCCG
jgi:SEC-C motif-containing protein